MKITSTAWPVKKLWPEKFQIETLPGIAIARAKAKYEEIGKLLKSVTLRNPALKTAQKLEGTLTTPSQSGKTVSTFNMTDSPREYETFHVWLELSKNEGGQYTVEVRGAGGLNRNV